MIGVNGITVRSAICVNAPKDAAQLTGNQTALGPQNPLLKMQVHLGKSTNRMKNSGFSIRMPEYFQNFSKTVPFPE
jgi:hypothetical protein